MKFFWSDLHLNTNNQTCLVGLRNWYFRGYQEWEDMVFAGLERIPPQSTLYILGDFAGEPQKFLPKIKKITQSSIYLIRGNHDPRMATCEWAFGKGMCRDAMITRVCGVPTWLSHYPHMFWRKSHSDGPGGSYHLFGHVHNQRTDFINEMFPGIRALDVCPESSYQHLKRWEPFSEEEVHEILSARPGHDDVRWCEGWRMKKIAEGNL